MSSKLVADFCSNHMGDRRIIEAGIKTLAEIGVDFCKFQSFRADRLNKNWPDYQKALEYYRSVELSDDDHVFILDKCLEYRIVPMFTVFDVERVQFLRQINHGAWQERAIVKIASPDANNWALISEALSRIGAVVISTGMHTPGQIKQLKEFVDDINVGCTRHVAYLYCVSKYPTPYEEIDFDRMQLFDGFSDHTEGLRAAKKAIDLGMGYIERHFTLGKHLPGLDHKFSSTPDEFRELVEYRDYVAKCELYKNRWLG